MPEWLPITVTILIAAIGGGVLIERRLAQLEVRHDGVRSTSDRLESAVQALTAMVGRLEVAVAAHATTVVSAEHQRTRLDELHLELARIGARLEAMEIRLRRIEESRTGRMITPAT